ncbi:hypothetical protein ZIOFF_045622 [Zingiber officinale]|uniref:Uncharacterized protein n=1 Tax=Zingiber officinale TaxID=94328 RepID=A0A8J5FYX8_ZINOF|nr:hypothetical protein ZIOFF_045622 [Zingiber officinale]
MHRKKAEAEEVQRSIIVTSSSLGLLATSRNPGKKSSLANPPSDLMSPPRDPSSRVEMGELGGFQLGTVGALCLSVVSSVSIVICNKALMSSLGFIFATTLMSWHLLVTFCSLHVALLLKLFEHKPFDQKAVMGFGILNGISIGLLNLSLGFNSVGFYQVHTFLLVINLM